MPKKPSNHLVFILAILCIGLAGYAIFASVLALKATTKLQHGEQKIQTLESQNVQLTKKVNQPVRPSSTPTATVSYGGLEKAEGFDALSTTTQEMLLRSPLNANIQKVFELRPGSVLVATKFQEPGTSPWLIDFAHQKFVQLFEPVYELGDVTFSRWKDGAVISRFTSPGEAVGNVEKKFLDASGKVLVSTLSGDYNRDGSTLEIYNSSGKFKVSLVHQGECTQAAYTEEMIEAQQPPTTTLIGLKVNGKLYPLPNHIVAECEIGYGESIGDPRLPTPSFDGRFVTFHITSYDVTVRSNGTVEYLPKISYYIQNGFRLLKEDEKGIHVLDGDIWNDPTFSVLQNRQYYFATKDIDDDTVHFLVTAYVENEEVPIGSVDYNLQTNKFENLVLTPQE